MKSSLARSASFEVARFSREAATARSCGRKPNGYMLPSLRDSGNAQLQKAPARDYVDPRLRFERVRCRRFRLAIFIVTRSVSEGLAHSLAYASGYGYDWGFGSAIDTPVPGRRLGSLHSS
jgi:hypothetical protein